MIFREPAQLHIHSYYSLLDAIPSPKEWMNWCLENDIPGISITDHGAAISLYDIVRFPKYVKEYNEKNGTNKNVTGIPGVELYVKLSEDDKQHFHINVWATTNEGYFNLMKLSSLAYQDTVNYFGSLKGRVTLDMLNKYRKGLKFGTACIASPFGKAIMDGNIEEAENLFKQYVDLFGDDLYVEFHPTDLTHNFNKKTGGFDPIPPNALFLDGNAQKGYNIFLSKMVDKYNVKCVPATDAHFIKPEDKIIQDIMLKSGNDNGWYFLESYHARKADEIYSKLKDHLGDWLTEEKFNVWIDNTYFIMEAAKSIDISFDYHLPKIEIPQHIQDKNPDYNMQTYYLLMEKIVKHGRWNNDPEYVSRFKKEIDVIKNNETLNFLPYFLLYEDISRFAREQGILQNIARGSAGGSLLSYYLKITHIDPIKKSLPFERFLSHARIRAGSFPDIDLDIGDKARGAVTAYLKDKYGLGFAQIATFNKMKTKNAIKDCMNALRGKNRNDPEVVEVCKTVPNSLQGVDEHDFLYGFTDQEGNYNPGQVEINEILANFFKVNPDIEESVKKLIGIPRGWSRHASAVVISTIDLSGERIPTMIMKDKNVGDITVTQYDAPMVEKCGLVKADILGIKTLTAVTECMELINKSSGIDYLEEDKNGVALIYRLPEDKTVYDDFYNKKTDSSFQFNTDLIKGYLPSFNPKSREDLSLLTSLIRPGALEAPMEETTAANYYIQVRNNKRELKLVHSDLLPILGETNGIYIYQEQVMKFLVDIAEYSWEESDQIRSAIAKKKQKVIMATFDRIKDAAKKRNWTEEQAETVCHQIQAFAKYGFNKAHAAAYSELGYITMYLKHHHKLEWWTSILNMDVTEEKLRSYINLLGDIIKPPSLKNPSNHFQIVDGFIVTPLSVIKKIGPKMAAELVEKGPFENLEDLVSRVSHTKVNIAAITALIKSRAADSLMEPKDGETYVETRKRFIDRYIELRGGKVKFSDEEVMNMNPIKMFLMERDHNQAFNKSLLDDDGILNMVIKCFEGLKKTGKKSIPFTMGDIPIVSNLKIARGLIDKNYEKDVGLILLFDSSNIKKITSKKTGKQYNMLSIALSDGSIISEGIIWNPKKALHLIKDSIVYVRGTLKNGYKNSISINVSEIENIGGIYD